MTTDRSLPNAVADAIRVEQERIAAQPKHLLVWTGEKARAWQSGMSNARRIAKLTIRNWLAEQAQSSLPLRERLEQALAPALWVSGYARGVGDQGYYVTDPRVAANLVLRAIQSPQQEDPTGAAWLEGQIERIRTAPLTDEEAIRESVLAADRIPVVGLRVDAPPTDEEKAFLADDTLRDALERVNATPEARSVPKSRPQTEPSDEQVLAALNAQVREDRRAPDLSYWGEQAVEGMRAALAAAWGAEK